MTRRLAVLIVGVVVGCLVLVGAGTLVLANVRARATTERELRTNAVQVARNIDQIIDPDTANNPVQLRRRLRLVKSISAVLPIDDVAVVVGTKAGVFDTVDLPPGVSPNDLRPESMVALEVVSGNHGNTVFAAAPTRASNGALVAVVLVQQANAGLGTSVRFFLFTAAATVILGLLAAIILGRRLTRPLRDAAAATQRIANGQLTTRLVEPPPTAQDELSELARSINGMAAGLQRSKVLEQQFLLSVSHDLRTPLTSIRGYAEAITDGAAEPAAAATVIRAESRRLERLVADLLDLAKLQSNSFALKTAAVDAASAVSAAVAGFVPDAAERDVHVHWQAPTGPRLMVSADPDRLAQVLANLLENAVRHARFEVVVTVVAEAARVRVLIDDDGPGIAPADLPHVFERLYVARSEPVRQESSSGLGLAIVRELVTAMGGTVGAGVAPSGGARLWIDLPVALPPPSSR